MRRAALFLALSLAAGPGLADDLHCSVHSDYAITLQDGLLRFVREDGSPGVVELRGGRLHVDGKLQTLSERDAARLARYLREAQALAPEVAAIALEAVDIAFLALVEVAEGLLDDSHGTVARLDEARERIEDDLRRRPIGLLDERRRDELVGDVVTELVPELIGEVVRAALTAAFTGDTARAEALEARAARIEKEVERRIEPRARALESRAESLCRRIATLDAIEQEMDYRLPDGGRLDLLRSGNH